jgi:hypothetical protein
MVDRALEGYQAYLQAVPNAPNRELAQSRITFLQAHRSGVVPTPHDAARQTQQQDPLTDTPRGGGGDVTGQWWFWTLIAVLVVGAGVGVTVGIVAGTSGVEGPLPGGVPVTMALEGL